jgi:hypothetical protein
MHSNVFFKDYTFMKIIEQEVMQYSGQVEFSASENNY